MLEAHRSIGDPDGIYGCGAGRLADTAARYVHMVRTHAGKYCNLIIRIPGLEYTGIS